MFFLFNSCIDISLAIKYAFENSQQSKLQLSPTSCIAAKPSSKQLPIATCTKSRAIVGPAPMLED